MSHTSRCQHCHSATSHQIALNSQPIQIAISRFVLLQTAGHQAQMCEELNGHYSVCYQAQTTPTSPLAWLNRPAPRGTTSPHQPPTS